MRACFAQPPCSSKIQYPCSGGEEESQLLFDARAALVRLHALLSLAPGGAAAEDEEVYEGLHRLLEVRGKLDRSAATVGKPVGMHF